MYVILLVRQKELTISEVYFMAGSFLILGGGLLIIVIAVVLSVVSSVVSTIASFIGTKGDDED